MRYLNFFILLLFIKNDCSPIYTYNILGDSFLNISKIFSYFLLHLIQIRRLSKNIAIQQYQFSLKYMIYIKKHKTCAYIRDSKGENELMWRDRHARKIHISAKLSPRRVLFHQICSSLPRVSSFLPIISVFSRIVYCCKLQFSAAHLDLVCF